MRTWPVIFLVVFLTIPIKKQLAAESENLIPRVEWSEIKANPLYCAIHSNGGYEVDLRLTKSVGVQVVRVSFIKQEKNAYSFDGHEHSVFAIAGDILWYADYGIGTQGGTVIAVELKTGKQLWSTTLEGLKPRRHSRYQNILNLDSDGRSVVIFGHETFGDYREVLDAVTGKQIKHELIREAPQKQEGEGKEGEKGT